MLDFDHRRSPQPSPQGERESGRDRCNGVSFPGGEGFRAATSPPRRGLFWRPLSPRERDRVRGDSPPPLQTHRHLSPEQPREKPAPAASIPARPLPVLAALDPSHPSSRRPAQAPRAAPRNLPALSARSDDDPANSPPKWQAPAASKARPWKAGLWPSAAAPGRGTEPAPAKAHRR